MPVIDLEMTINAPPERVFDLARSVELHTASTSRSKERAIAGITHGLIGLGEHVTWRARYFMLWHQLTSQITQFDRPRHFRDSLVEGSFTRFDHDHFFESHNNGARTLMRDRFDFTSRYDLLGQIVDSSSSYDS